MTTTAATRMMAGDRGIGVVALDLDGTIMPATEIVDQCVLDRLASVRKSGVKVILATGRCLFDLEKLIDVTIFDALVLENGALLIAGGKTTSLAPAGWDSVRQRMLELFITNSKEQVIVALKREMEDQVRPYLDGGIRMEFNKASLMLVPANVSKGAGILAALRELDLEHATVMCLGDGENDLEMFRVCHVRVAVRNSVEVLKEQADFVTTEDNGKGVSEAIDKYILDSRENSRNRSVPNET